MKKYLIIFLIIFIFYEASPSLAIYTVPSSRIVTWQGNIGVKGGIPTNRTQCGSTITAGSGDRRSEIQTAINNCGSDQYVLLGAGNFNVSGTLTLKSNMTLKGSGIGSTTITQTSGSSGATVSFNGGTYSSTDYSWSAGYSKGTTSITTSSPTGYSTGDIILLDQTNAGTGNDPPITNVGTDGTCSWCGRDSGTRSTGQLNEIAGISGTSISLDIGLYWDYASGQSPQVVKLDSVNYAGLEDLKIDNSSTMNGNQSESGTVNMIGAANCWIEDVVVHGINRIGINVRYVYRATINRVSVHLTDGYTSNHGYGLWMRDGVSASLLQNCIFYDLADGPIVNGPVSGNVIAYNYIYDLTSTDYPTAVRIAIAFHGAHPFMNLLEGNYCDGNYIGLDFYWGSNSNNTLFRNYSYPDAAKTAQETSMVIAWRGYYTSVIGGILGRNFETLYIRNSIPYTGDPESIFVIELGGSDNTLETTLLHQNYDYYHDSQTLCDNADNPGCQGGSNDATLPDSLYLSSKPGWFGSLTYPPIDPSGPTVNDIPAKMAYDNIIGDIPQWPEESQAAAAVPNVSIGALIDIGNGLISIE